MVLRLQYVFYAASFFFYILVLMGSERLWREDVAAGSDENESWPALWRAHRRHYPKSRLRAGIAARVAMVLLCAASGTLLMVMEQRPGNISRHRPSGAAYEVRSGIRLGGSDTLMALPNGMRCAGAGMKLGRLLQQASETLHFKLDGGGSDAPVVLHDHEVTVRGKHAAVYATGDALLRRFA